MTKYSLNLFRQKYQHLLCCMPLPLPSLLSMFDVVPPQMMRGLRSGLGVAAAELSGVRHEVQQMKYDSACVREMIQAYHNESMEFFRVFTESLEATQQGFEAIQVCTGGSVRMYARLRM